MLLNSDRYKFHSRKTAVKRRRLRFVLGILGLGVCIALLVLFALPALRGKKTSQKAASKDVTELWNLGLYDEVISLCEKKTEANPLDQESLIFYGFAQYYKAFHEKALEIKIPLLDGAIATLRRARLAKNFQSNQVDYILGQAYFHKGKFYFDLTIKYIEKSIEEGYIGRDSYEYLGLAYGGIDNTEKELEYFLKASEESETDLLLLSVGKAYNKLKDFDPAEDYLLRSLNKTSDPDIEKECRFKLADIYTQKNDLLKAEEQLKAIIQLDPNSAVAHFQLGEVYLKMVDYVRARAEWRKTLTIDPNHHGAKLRYYK